MAGNFDRKFVLDYKSGEILSEMWINTCQESKTPKKIIFSILIIDHVIRFWEKL